MTNDTPAPDAPPPIPHRAPPLDTRPRSRLAVWALVTSLGLAILGAVLGLMWVVTGAGLVLGLAALFRIPARSMRGQGMAVAALLISLLVGSCQYMFASTMRESADRVGRGVMWRLSSDAPQKADAWLTEDALAAGAGEKILARYEAVVHSAGAFRRELDSGSTFGSVYAIVLPPTGVTEIVAEGEEPARPRPGGLWLRASFEGGVVYVELLLDEDASRLATRLSETTGAPARVLQDVHFYKQDP